MDLKLAAVKKVVEQWLTLTEVAKDLGISDTAIRSWKQKFYNDGTLFNHVAKNVPSKLNSNGSARKTASSKSSERNYL